jgi:hypothetical protein
MDMAHIKWRPHYEKEIWREGPHTFPVFYQLSTYTDKQVTTLKKKVPITCDILFEEIFILGYLNQIKAIKIKLINDFVSSFFEVSK